MPSNSSWGQRAISTRKNSTSSTWETDPSFFPTQWYFPPNADEIKNRSNWAQIDDVQCSLPRRTHRNLQWKYQVDNEKTNWWEDQEKRGVEVMPTYMIVYCLWTKIVIIFIIIWLISYLIEYSFWFHPISNFFECILYCFTRMQK